MTLRRVALLAVSANLLAACGGGGKDDLQVAVDRLNGGDASVRLRASLAEGGGVSLCRITPQPDRPERLQLTVVMKDGSWYQATLDPEMDEKLRSENVATGKELRAALRARAPGGAPHDRSGVHRLSRRRRGDV